MKLKSFFLALLTFAILFMITPVESKAQSTTTGTFKQLTDKHMTWTVASGDFDSLDVIWTRGFYLQSDKTFSTRGSINLGTVATDETYSTVLLLYVSYDEGDSFILSDSLGTITSTTAAGFTVDVDDLGPGPIYKIKATNGGGDNSLRLGIERD